MYSPKIAEDLIPELYRIKQELKVPMTGLVNYIIREFIKEWKNETDSHTLGRDGNPGSTG